MRRLKGVVGALLIGATLSCGGGDHGVTDVAADPGAVNVVLSTPNIDDGAVLIRVTGGAVSSVTAQGYEIASSTPDATGVTVLVRGNIGSGLIARLQLPDRSKLAQYHAIVVEAAARGTYQQQSVTGYSVSVGPP